MFVKGILIVPYMDLLVMKYDLPIFRSPRAKIGPSFNFSFKHHLLLNHRTNFIQTSQECFLALFQKI